MSHAHADSVAASLSVAVLTISDTRELANDTSGNYLVQALEQDGHVVHDRRIVKDDIYAIRAAVSAWIADPQVAVVLTTGGTGFAGRDSTPEAVSVLFDKTIDGFGELFRRVSHNEIGTSTIQSRAVAGLANRTLICCLPGSTGACRTGWEQIIRAQLDSRTRPCNFVANLKQSALCATRG